MIKTKSSELENAVFLLYLLDIKSKAISVLRLLTYHDVIEMSSVPVSLELVLVQGVRLKLMSDVKRDDKLEDLLR